MGVKPKKGGSVRIATSLFLVALLTTVFATFAGPVDGIPQPPKPVPPAIYADVIPQPLNPVPLVMFAGIPQPPKPVPPAMFAGIPQPPKPVPPDGIPQPPKPVPPTASA